MVLRKIPKISKSELNSRTFYRTFYFKGVGFTMGGGGFTMCGGVFTTNYPVFTELPQI